MCSLIVTCCLRCWAWSTPTPPSASPSRRVKVEFAHHQPGNKRAGKKRTNADVKCAISRCHGGHAERNLQPSMAPHQCFNAQKGGRRENCKPGVQSRIGPRTNEHHESDAAWRFGANCAPPASDALDLASSGVGPMSGRVQPGRSPKRGRPSLWARRRDREAPSFFHNCSRTVASPTAPPLCPQTSVGAGPITEPAQGFQPSTTEVASCRDGPASPGWGPSPATVGCMALRPAGTLLAPNVWLKPLGGGGFASVSTRTESVHAFFAVGVRMAALPPLWRAGRPSGVYRDTVPRIQRGGIAKRKYSNR